MEAAGPCFLWVQGMRDGTSLSAFNLINSLAFDINMEGRPSRDLFSRSERVYYVSYTFHHRQLPDMALASTPAYGPHEGTQTK